MGKSSRGSRCCHRGHRGGERERETADVSLPLSVWGAGFVLSSLKQVRRDNSPTCFDRVMRPSTAGWSDLCASLLWWRLSVTAAWGKHKVPPTPPEELFNFLCNWSVTSWLKKHNPKIKHDITEGQMINERKRLITSSTESLMSMNVMERCASAFYSRLQTARNFQSESPKSRSGQYVMMSAGKHQTPECFNYMWTHMSLQSHKALTHR